MLKNVYLLLASLFIIFLTVISLKESSEFSIGVMPYADKLFHFLAYALLTILWCKYLFYSMAKTSKKIIFIIVFLLLSSYGIVIEVLQTTLTMSRVFELNDIVANITGIGVGIIISKYSNKFKLKSNKGLLF